MFLQLFLVLLASSLVKPSAINVNIFTDEKAKEVSLTTCEDKACEDICKRFGYKEGLCSNGQCMCLYYIGQTKLEPKVSYSTVDSCNFQSCDQLCRNLGFPGGACVGDRCDCDNFKPLQDFLNLIVREKSNGYENIVEHRMNNKDIGKPEKDIPCAIGTCNEFCILSHYHGGICIGSSCTCY